MDILKKMSIMAAGIGLSGLIGAVSAIVLLYVLIEAAIAGADEVIWLYLSGVVGVIVGGICFKIVLWANKGQKSVR